MLLNSKNPRADLEARDAKDAARAVKQELFVLKASSQREIDTAFVTLIEQRAKGLLVSADPFFTNRREQVIALAAHHAVPTMYFIREFPSAGGLMSYGPNYTDTYRQAGIYTGRILRGEKPADLPVMQPTKFEFVHQPQDRQDTRSDRAANAARACRRGNRVKRREFISVLGGAAAWPSAARAQQPGKVPTIGLLGASTAAAWSPWVTPFVLRLRELGWIEGRTINIEYRWAEGRNEHAAEIAVEFVQRKVDIIVCVGGETAKRATSEIPVVFAISSDPLGTGLVASLPRPGGNLTGFFDTSN